MWITRQLQKLSKSAVFLIGFWIVVILGIFDYLNGPDISFLLFYLPPILLVDWFAGKGAAILLSIVAAFAWFADDVLGRSTLAYPLVSYWNAGAKFLVFLVTIHLLSNLKDALEREKEAEKQRFHREIQIAREVQVHLFPHFVPKMKTLDYAGVCKPADTVSGDYYDFLQLAPNRLGIAIADVCGKGIPAALLMAGIYGMIRSYAFLYGLEVDKIATDASRLLYESTDTNRFSTLIYAVYEDDQRTLTYVNAGHNPPLLFRGSKHLSGHDSKNSVNPSFGPSRLNTAGPPLGLLPNSKYSPARLSLEPGDLIVFYTDGVPEAWNIRQEEFGVEKLIEVILQNLHLSPLQLRDLILSRIFEFAGPTKQHDDITLILAKVI